MSEGQAFELPQYFDRLTAEDQREYKMMQQQVGGEEMRYNRNKRLVTFTDQMNIVKQYCIRNDANDTLRCSVCGIYWLDSDTMAINIRQFRLLLAKSKSSINGALAKMGYTTVQSNANNFRTLASLVPPLKNQSMEMRQWTIRRRSSGVLSPQPTVSQPIAQEVERQEPTSPVSINDFEQFDAHWPLNDPVTVSNSIGDLCLFDYNRGSDLVLDTKPDYNYPFLDEPDEPADPFFATHGFSAL